MTKKNIRASAALAKGSAHQWAMRIEDWHAMWLNACDAAEHGRAWSVGVDGRPDLASPRDVEAHAARSVTTVHIGPPQPSGRRFHIVLPSAEGDTASHQASVIGRLLGAERIGCATLAYAVGAELCKLDETFDGALIWFAGVCLDAERARTIEEDAQAREELHPYTVQCGYWGAHECVVEVEARDPDEACRKAVEVASQGGDWKDSDLHSPCHVVYIGDGHTAPSVRADHDVPEEWMGPTLDQGLA